LRSERDVRARKASKLLLAQVYLRLGDRASSERERAEAQACDDPGWGDPYLSELRRLQRGVKDLLVRADLLLGKERYAEAVQILEEAARGYPDSVWTWILLARAHIKLRDIPAAQDALRRALLLEPSSAEALFRMGVTFTLQEAYADAAGWFRKAIAAKPDFARAHFNLGYCLQQLGQRRAAIESFLAAVESEPGNAEAEGLLGHLLTLEGDPGSGAEHLRRALELDPKNAWLRQRLAEAEGRSP
jgi:tetratricopeptide (TPR) repeat protein